MHNLHDEFVKHTLGNPVGAKAFIEYHFLKAYSGKNQFGFFCGAFIYSRLPPSVTIIQKQIQSKDFYFSRDWLFLYFLSKNHKQLIWCITHTLLYETKRLLA